MIETLVSDGTVTLVALAVLTVELVALMFIRQRGFRVGDVVANALSGVFLILALRSSIMEYGPTAIAAFLGLAFAAHVVGLLVRRWQ